MAYKEDAGEALGGPAPLPGPSEGPLMPILGHLLGQKGGQATKPKNVDFTMGF